MSAVHQSQENKILRLLQSRGLAWTPAPELALISLGYTSRIAALRARGIPIQNLVEVRNGTKMGFYRITPRPERSTVGADYISGKIGLPFPRCASETSR